MDTARVSVVMPVYNGERYVREAIGSVFAQTYQNWELLVINDGSTDKTGEEVQRTPHSKNVRILTQANKGVATARNIGIANSSGSLIAFIDHDDLWLPTKLEMQVEFLLRNPTVPLVHSNRSDIDAYGNRLDPDRPMDAQGNCFPDLFSRNRIVTSTVVIRRSCLEWVGVFRKEFTPCEDYDLWLRVARWFPIGYLNDILALYRFHNTNTSRASLKMTRTEFALLDAMVKEVPEIYELVDHRTVRKRLSDLLYAIGCYYMWTKQRHDIAKTYFWKSIEQTPFHWRSYWRSYKWMLWCSLSSRERKMCSWYFYKLSRIGRR